MSASRCARARDCCVRGRREPRAREPQRAAPPRRPAHARRVAVLAVAAALFAAHVRRAPGDQGPERLIANFYTVPIALLAIEFGMRGGVLGAAVALVLVFAWGVLQTVNLGWLGYTSRGAACW